MKDIITQDINDILIHFPLKKNGASFKKIYSAYPFSKIDNFSILKNTSNGESKENERNLNIVIKRNSISLESEILIAGKAFCEFKANETAYYVNKKDYFFNELTLKELNIDVNYTVVKKGKYIIAISEDKISILFILKRKK